MLPETRYAKSGEHYIAYQTIGEGPRDLVMVPGFVWHLEEQWEAPDYAGWARRLATFSRLIIVDKRGTGLSDRVPINEMPTLEERMDDLRAVLDAAGSRDAALLGFWEGGPMCALFAATYPERTTALILYGTMATFSNTEDHPWVPTAEQNEVAAASLAESWGQGFLGEFLVPSRRGDEAFRRWFGRMERLGVSPGGAIALWRLNAAIDVRSILPTIRVPTLVLHRANDPAVPVEAGRYLAEHVPGARFVELTGSDHLPWVGDAETPVGEIEEFLTGARAAAEADRVLATILFVDIVASTEHARSLGDRRWTDILDAHRLRARREITRFRGREIDTAGDGFFALFDGPARAVRCAEAVRAAVADLGIAVRAGLHTGECEVSGDDVSGIAVHIGARVMAAAQPSEILVSRTVRDLVAGSGLRFQDRGPHELRGVPGEWQLFAVAG